MDILFGGIEAGGTKFALAVGSGPNDLRDEFRTETTNPTDTIGRAIKYFKQQNLRHPLSAIGVGSFGPIDMAPESPTYGYIKSTSKLGWSNTDFVGRLSRELNLPVGFNTDVNAAALAEYLWGVAKGVDNFLYLTIGTGIGGAAFIDGQPLFGLNHSEMGHIFIPHNLETDPFAGICPFHNDCFEGLASGPAIEYRWGIKPEQLPQDHPAWVLEAQYIAFGLISFILTLSPKIIVLGGGVMGQIHLFPLVRDRVLELLNEFVQVPMISKDSSHYIVPPQLGNKAGVLGAIALAKQELERLS
jgi:fructokinase